MWFINKILWTNHDGHDAIVVLNKVSKPIKSRYSDLLRHWYIKNYPTKAPKGLSRVLGNLNRLNKWLDGWYSEAVEDAISNLRNPEKSVNNEKNEEIEENIIIVRGWFPSIHSAIDYELVLTPSSSRSKMLSILGYEKTPFYKLKDVLFMVRRELTPTRLEPIIQFIAQKQGARRNNGQLVKHQVIKKFRKMIPWDQINQTSYSRWINNRVPYMDPSSKKLANVIFQTFYNKALWFCSIFLSAYKHRVMNQKEMQDLYNSVLLDPQILGLSSDDTNRLCLMLGKPILLESEEAVMEQTKLLKDNLKNHTWISAVKVPTVKESRFIKSIGVGFSLRTDLQKEKKLSEWLEDTKIICGVPTSDDILAENLPLMCYHPDDYFYCSCTMPVDKTVKWCEKVTSYMIGNAHRIGLDEWVYLMNNMPSPPSLLIGRLDQYSKGRGQLFRDLLSINKNVLNRPNPVCDNILCMTMDEWEQKDIEVDQIFYSSDSIMTKARERKFEKNMNRVWLYKPKRVRTIEFIRKKVIRFVENDLEQDRHLNMFQWNDANYIKSFQSIGRINNAMVLVDKMKDFDLYTIRTYVSDTIYLVGECKPSIPGISIDEAPKRNTSLNMAV